MGIFSGLFRSRDKPTDSTVGSRYAFYIGGSSSGKVVTERSAMQMTAARKKHSTIRYTFCSMTSRTRR